MKSISIVIAKFLNCNCENCLLDGAEHYHIIVVSAECSQILPPAFLSAVSGSLIFAFMGSQIQLNGSLGFVFARKIACAIEEAHDDGKIPLTHSTDADFIAAHCTPNTVPQPVTEIEMADDDAFAAMVTQRLTRSIDDSSLFAMA